MEIERYVTVWWIGYLHTPVLVARHPNGYRQVADLLPGEDDALSAKRNAVVWAKRLDLPFVVPGTERPDPSLQKQKF